MKIFTLLISVILVLGVMFFIRGNLIEAKDILEECKEQGYDGVIKIKTNYLDDEIQCTYFSAEEKARLKKYKVRNDMKQSFIDKIFLMQD